MINPKNSSIPDAKWGNYIHWENNFPRKEYGTTQRGKDLRLHFLMALDQPDDMILSLIERNQDKNTPFLTSIDAKTKWTPLHIAVIKGREVIVDALLKTHAKAQIDLPDLYDWTPLHHSALSADSIYRKLLTAGANPRAQNLYQGTPADIHALSHSPGTRAPSTTVSISGSLVPVTELTQQQLKDTLGLDEWRELPLFPPKYWATLWQTTPKGVSTGGVLNQAYLEYHQNPTRLVIKKEVGLEGCSENVLGLASGQPIKAGTIIFEYAGLCEEVSWDYHPLTMLQILEKDDRESAYYLKPYNALKVGSAGRMANCGWPCGTIHFVIDGGCMKSVLVAGRDIEEGEPLYWDYGFGAYELSLGVQRILGEDKMMQYYSRGFEAAYQDYIANSKNLADQKEISNANQFAQFLEKNYLLFPLNCPTAMLKLHFAGLVAAQKWEALLSDPNVENEFPLFYDWAITKSHTHWMVRSILKRVIEFDLFLNENPGIKKQAVEWISERIGKISILHILKAMAMIKEGNPTSANWTKFITNVAGNLVHYKATEKQRGPLSLAQRVDDYLEAVSKLVSSKFQLLQVLHQNLENLKEHVHQNSDEAQFVMLAIQKTEQSMVRK